MDLKAYDWIVINSSAGKDSQAMLDYVVELAGPELKSRLVVVHADLGRVEWKGTRELAQAQAEHYGLRFEVAQREQDDLLEYVEKRGFWPSSKARFCTSEFKRAPIAKILTKLARESGRPVRILSCMGLRAQESPARSKLQAFELDARNTNSKRTVERWLPIHSWTAAQVWARIRASGVAHHPAYDAGMPRLSCCFCIFAPKAALMLAGKHNPELLEEYVRVERKIDHKFRQDFSLAQMQAELAAGAQAPAVADWRM